jgi:hypothetical protein
MIYVWKNWGKSAKSNNQVYLKRLGLIYIIGVILSFPRKIQAQATDTLSSKATNRVASILSSLTLRAQFGTESNAGYKLKQHNGDLYGKGTMQEVAKIRMTLNIPVLKTKFTALSISPYYANHHLNFNREEVLSENLLMDMNGVHNTWGISTFGNFHTKLFGKQAAGMARFAIDGSEFGLERFTCMAPDFVNVSPKTHH